MIAKWRRFKNGTAHLVHWCAHCDKQVSGNPMPKERADEFGLPAHDEILTRWAVEFDLTWPK